MLLAAFAATVLAASPDPVKLAAPGFTAVQMPEDVVRFFSEHFAQKLNELGCRVTTAQQITTLLGFERQKTLMACTEQSCAAELANALGVDGIISGQVGKFGSSYQANISIISARTAEILAAHSVHATSEDAILEELSRAAQAMAPEVARNLRRISQPAPLAAQGAPANAGVSQPPPVASQGAPNAGGSRTGTWISAGVGVACVLGSAGTLYGAEVNAAQLRKATEQQPWSSTQATSYRNRGNTLLLTGVGLGIAGAAALGTATWMFLSEPAAPKLSIVPMSSGALVSFSGVLP